MALVGFALGFVDLSSPLPLVQVADLLSSKVFGGIRFIEKDVDEDYDVGTLCLEHDFLGLQVDLSGDNGRYTVEIGTRPSASVPGIDEVCDLSAMLAHRIKGLGTCELELS